MQLYPIYLFNYIILIIDNQKINCHLLDSLIRNELSFSHLLHQTRIAYLTLVRTALITTNHNKMLMFYNPYNNYHVYNEC